MFWNILNRLGPKKSTKTFWLCHFFHYFVPFGQKTTESDQRNFTRGKILDSEIFGLRYVLNILNRFRLKKFSTNFFLTLSFFKYIGPFGRKTRVRAKTFYTGKKFWLQDFRFKYVLKHSESIPTKKSFDQNFLTLSFFNYFGPVGRKMRVRVKKILHWTKFSISRFSV